jgi:hypothetical protein
VFLDNFQIGFLHHLIERFRIKPIEKSNKLELLDNIRDFVMVPAVFPSIILAKIDHHHGIIFFEQFQPFKMTV